VTTMTQASASRFSRQRRASRAAMKPLISHAQKSIEPAWPPQRAVTAGRAHGTTGDFPNVAHAEIAGDQQYIDDER